MEEIPIESQEQRKSPYLSIWFHPRKTIRHILKTNPDKHVMLFAIILGILRVFDKASDQALFDKIQLPFWGFMLFCIIMGLIFGPINIYIYAWVYRWVGSWFNGQADSRQIRTVYAWSSFPKLFMLLIWVMLLIPFGQELFSEITPYIDNHLETYMLIMAPVTIISFVLIVWNTVLLIINLAEVHRFSIWKGIATYFLPFLVVMIPMFFFLLLNSTH